MKNNEHTHELDSLSEGHVIGDNLAQLWEVPAVPLPRAHDVVVQFFVKVIEKGDRLHDHRVHFVRTELQLVTRQAENYKNVITNHKQMGDYVQAYCNSFRLIKS